MKPFALMSFFKAYLMLGLIACTHEGSRTLDPFSTNIRLRNKSAFAFENVNINPYNEPASYGNIAAGETTGYKSFEVAYRYAYVRLDIGGRGF